MARIDTSSSPSSSSLSCYGASSVRGDDDPEDEKRCRACHSSKPLYVDWSQGDRVCTECGVVDEGHVMDPAPEWRDFNDVDDLVRGGPAPARCGLIPVDETLYIGGLQPTKLSKYCFSGSTSGSKTSPALLGNAHLQKRLVAANHRIDRRMEKAHARAITNAQLTLRLRQKRRRRVSLQDSDKDNDEDVDTDTDTDEHIHEDDGIPTGLEQLLVRDEQEVARMRSALYADKWSLQRAIRLCSQDSSGEGEKWEEQEDSAPKLDTTLQRASEDLFCAYTMLSVAAKRLDLPDRVTHEATQMLCQYASRRDGLKVKGIETSFMSHPTMASLAKTSGSTIRHHRKAVLRANRDSIQEYSKARQMGALCAGLLFLLGRTMKQPRSCNEICDSIKSSDATFATAYLREHANEPFVKRKHCNRAISELKETFPLLAESEHLKDRKSLVHHSDEQPNTLSTTAIFNLTEHILRKLNLPPVAESAIHCLVGYYTGAMQAEGDGNGLNTTSKKLNTICASLAFFVCSAGATMQRLALQSRKTLSNPGGGNSIKRRKFESQEQDRVVAELVHQERIELSAMANHDASDGERLLGVSFHGWKDFAAEQHAYEMRRMWDAWSEQRPWDRNLMDFENSCGVSRKVLVEFYQKKLYADRQELLSVLQEAVTASTACIKEASSRILSETPLASILLKHFTAAAPLMKKK